MPRGKTENLVKNAELTPKERKEKASKAGKASAESRRKKKDMREVAKMLLGMAAKGKDLNKSLEAFGIPESDRTNMAGILARMTLEAQEGNIKAAEFVRDTAGYAPEKAGNNVNLNIDNGEKKGLVIYMPDNGRDKKDD